MPVRFARTVLLVSLAAASFAASAQIHRCKDEKGQTLLSDRPCATDTAAHQDAPRGSAGSAVDRIAAPQMASARLRDMSSEYDFIPERGARPATQATQRK